MSGPGGKPSIHKTKKIENDKDDDNELVNSDEDSCIIEPSFLGLNHIRTRSAPWVLNSGNSIEMGSTSAGCSTDRGAERKTHIGASTPQVSTGQGHLFCHVIVPFLS